jgi:hypothetical protein
VTKRALKSRNGTKPNSKTAGKGRKDASPINGVVPPPEHRFKPGDPGGPGRPKTLKELKDLIITTLAEEMATTDEAGHKVRLTRAQDMIRTMLVKSPIDRAKLLEYAFGKVPQTVNVLDGRLRIVQLLKAGDVTPAEVIAELGRDLATELFESAGISVAEGAEAGAEGGATASGADSAADE